MRGCDIFRLILCHKVAERPWLGVVDGFRAFAGDELKSDTESSSSSEDENTENSKKEQPSGFFILQHRNAQDNLRVLTEQKLRVCPLCAVMSRHGLYVGTMPILPHCS